jgi:hypothetical protein
MLCNSNNIKGQSKQKISSWIEKEPQSKELAFKAYFKNESPTIIQSLYYEFSGVKKSQSGEASINQSGNFEAEPSEKILLSTINMGKDQDEKKVIELYLKIYHNKNLLITDSLTISP